jgi:hypothetical protein
MRKPEGQSRNSERTAHAHAAHIRTNVMRNCTRMKERAGVSKSGGLGAPASDLSEVRRVAPGELLSFRSEQPYPHTVFFRICRMFKEVFRWLGNRMAGKSHDIFPLLPKVTGHSNREQFRGETLGFLA